MLTPDERRYVEEVRQRAEAATPGPWERKGVAVPTIYVDGLEFGDADIAKIVSCDCGEGRERDLFRHRDATFIQEAREDIPALLAIIDRLTKQHPPI
jgi:hypothetical protein